MNNLDILDRICPDEAGLPPSERTWARMVRLLGGFEALELRDPNDGQGADPATKTRHQYLIHDGHLWVRHLPPAPLDQARDEAQRLYGPDASRWRLVEPGSGLPWDWAVAHGVRPYATHPQPVEGEWDLRGDGDCATVGYIMPPRDPWDMWAAVTGAPCPLCGRDLVWYEAGYVSGYRVCADLVAAGDRYDLDSIRHRWLWTDGTLVLDGDEMPEEE